MKPPTLLMVPFREVRHDQPDECLHYEGVAVRGREMNWTIPAHRHDGLHQFQLLVKGGMTGMIDGRNFEADAPAMLMLAPGSVHGFTYTRDAVGHQVTVPTATLQQLLGGSNLADSELGASFVLHGASCKAGAREAGATFDALAGEFKGHSPGRVHSLLAYATLLAVHFLRSRGESLSAEARQGVRDTLVQRYRTLLEKHYREHRPLAFYAGALNVTPDHLSRTCRTVAGQSALELLHDRLMLEARRLLAYTPMTVAEVAAELGYDDPAYFSKFFAKAMGQAPSAYRSAVARGIS